MVACPLCILGVPEEEHSPERFGAITEAEREIIDAHNHEHPGVLIEGEVLEHRLYRLDVICDARLQAVRDRARRKILDETIDTW